MAKKKEPEKPSMELEYHERIALTELQNSREALTELQNAIIPIARGIAMNQRKWWDNVLESRGLSREGTSYAVEDGRRIIDQKERVMKGDLYSNKE